MPKLLLTPSHAALPLPYPTTLPARLALRAHPSAPTPFQYRVYDALLAATPHPGQTTTYGALARTLRSSPRAVGGALGRNPFAPEVPCHRVLREDGALGGFMGSTTGPLVARKLELLRSEGVALAEVKPGVFKLAAGGAAAGNGGGQL